MKTLPMTFAAAALALTPAFAMGEGAVEVDANGDGVLTMDEVVAVFPAVTAESFSEMDTDNDGVLGDEEIKAAEESGMLAPAE